MHLHLKLKIKSLAQQAKDIRQAERHTITKGRALVGKWDWSKKHKKGEKKPEQPEVPLYVERALAWMKEHTVEGVFMDEAQKALDDAYIKYWGLQRFRTVVLRKSARHSLLAYGFLRGRKYEQIESTGCYELPDFAEVKRMAFKFAQEDERIIRQRWAEWVEEAAKALAGDNKQVEEILLAQAA